MLPYISCTNWDTKRRNFSLPRSFSTINFPQRPISRPLYERTISFERKLVVWPCVNCLWKWPDDKCNAIFDWDLDLGVEKMIRMEKAAHQGQTFAGASRLLFFGFSVRVAPEGKNKTEILYKVLHLSNMLWCKCSILFCFNSKCRWAFLSLKDKKRKSKPFSDLTKRFVTKEIPGKWWERERENIKRWKEDRFLWPFTWDSLSNNMWMQFTICHSDAQSVRVITRKYVQSPILYSLHVYFRPSTRPMTIRDVLGSEDWMTW